MIGSKFIAKRMARDSEVSHSRVIIRIAIIATALCIAVMIIATALIKGFKTEVGNKVFGFWGHINITDYKSNFSQPVPIEKSALFVANLDTIQRIRHAQYLESNSSEPTVTYQESQGGIKHVQTYVLKPGIIKTKEDMEGILLKGVTEDFNWSFLDQYITAGEKIEITEGKENRGVLISEITAKRMDLSLDDRFIIFFVVDGKQRRKAFNIAGIYNTNLAEYDKKIAIADANALRPLLGYNDNEIAGYEIYLDNLDDIDMMRDYLYVEAIPPDLHATTIKENEPGIFHWLDLQDYNEVVILSLMTAVAILNMITALLILIIERTNMIGILKSLGYNNRNIRYIFLHNIFHILMWGMLIGNVIGIGICLIQKWTGLIKLSEEDYYLSVAPIQFNYPMMLAINIGVILITFLVLLIPSSYISRISPVKAIKFA